MFKRSGEFFIILATDVSTLEAVSEWVYTNLKISYMIQIDQFSNMTVYHICIPCRNDFDKKIKRGITEHLKDRNLYPLEES